MSIDTCCHIKEIQPGMYLVLYGTLSENEGLEEFHGRCLLQTDDLKLAIETAQSQPLEYGLSFEWYAGA